MGYTVALPKDDIKTLVHEAPWFSYLPDEALDRLADAAISQHFSKGSLIHGKGDKAKGVFCVVKGRLRASHTTLEGHEIVLNDAVPGIWFGELTLEDGGARTHDMHAQEDSVILFICRNVLLDIGEQWPELYRGLFSVLARRMRSTFGLLDMSHQGVSLKVRLAYRLLQFIQVYGEDVTEGIELKMAITQSDLALLSGGSRQHINQILKAWSEEGIIRNGANLMILDRAALEEAAEF